MQTGEECYLELLNKVVNKSTWRASRPGIRTKSLFGEQFRCTVGREFPLLTTKSVPIRWVFEELKWFLSGSTWEPDLAEKGVDIWAEWSTAEKCAKFNRMKGDLGPVYGHLWRNFGGTVGPGVDQIKKLLEGLENDPLSRRHIVSGWHPKEAERVELPPCHTLFQMYAEPIAEIHSRIGGQFLYKYDLHLYARSIDIFLGLPFNIASYALLLKLISHVLRGCAGDLIISFGDLHLYENHLEQAKTQLSRKPNNPPYILVDIDRKEKTALEALLSVTFKDIHMIGYKPQPKIIAEVAV